MLAQLELRYLTLGVLLYLPFIGGMTLRWQAFLRQHDITLPFVDVLSLTWSGQFFNSFLPGSTGGDVVKIYQLCRRMPERKAAAASTVIADRLIALIALLILAGSALIIEPAPLQLLRGVALPLKAIALAVVFVLLAAWVLSRIIQPAEWIARLRKIVQACRQALTFNSRLAAGLLLGLLVHLVNFTIIYFFARALRTSMSYTQVVLMMPVVLFLLLLPLTINGHGLREVLLVGYFSYFRVQSSGQPAAGSNDLAIALSLLMVANDLFCSLPGGIWYFSKFGGLHRRALDTTVASSPG